MSRKAKSFEVPSTPNIANGIDINALKMAGLDDITIAAILSGQVTAKEPDSSAPKDPYIEIKGLPSDGLFYKDRFGNPITIKGMPLKAMDALLLETMFNSEDESLIDDLLRRRITGIDPKDLILADEIYILAWLREQTFYNTPIRVNHTCDKCDHFNEGQVVTLNDFLIMKCPEHIKTDPHPVQLPISKQTVHLRFTRKRDKDSAKKYLESISAIKKITAFDNKVAKLASVIHGMSVKQSIEFFKELEAVDFAHLYNEFDKMNITFTEAAILKCGFTDGKGECGYENIVPISFQSNFFLPEIGFESSY